MSIVELKGITKTYRTGAIAVRALRSIDLIINEGEYVAIMGQSGSGKSTLMNLLGCLDRPTSGSFFLNGKDVSSFSRDRLSQLRNRTIGFVFQSFHLLPRTSALENVELPLLYSEENLSWKEIRERAEHALEIVSLSDRMDHTPNELSGGQKQRVAIARALVTNPRLLLTDEPTGNLDSRTSLEIVDMIQQLNSDGLTVLMVTHEPEIARFSSRTIILRDGLVRSDRRTDPLRASIALENWIDESEVVIEGEDLQ